MGPAVFNTVAMAPARRREGSTPSHSRQRHRYGFRTGTRIPLSDLLKDLAETSVLDTNLTPTGRGCVGTVSEASDRGAQQHGEQEAWQRRRQRRPAERRALDGQVRRPRGTSPVRLRAHARGRVRPTRGRAFARSTKARWCSATMHRRGIPSRLADSVADRARPSDVPPVRAAHSHPSSAARRMQLKALEPLHVQGRLYRFWLDRGLSPTTVGHLHALLHRAMGQAQKWRYVQQNVVALVTKPKSVRQEMSTLSAKRSVPSCSPPRRATGLRLSTCSRSARGCGRERSWPCAGPTSTSIVAWRKVSATLQPTAEGLRRSNPKTRTSRRGVQLPVVAIDALRRHRVRQTRRGSRWAQSGSSLNSSSPLRWAGRLPLHRFYACPSIRCSREPACRISASTTCAIRPRRFSWNRACTRRIVSEMLGHSTIAITLDLYSHVTPTMQEQAAAAMDAVLRGG